MHPSILRVHFKRSAKDLYDDAYAMIFVCVVFVVFSSDFLYKNICCWYPFELHRQMGTHNMCLYKKVDKKYTGSNPKTTKCLTVRL